jgi:uncharacterized pyridoxamine 5'-phosphate oxidase family protein
MDEVLQFLKEAKTYFLATADGNQPRVRPFGTICKYEDKLYIQTGHVKDVYQQIEKNPKIELCAMGKDGQWLRLSATAVRDDRREAREHMLNEYPSLKGRYSADDGNCEVLYLKDVTASFCSFVCEPKVLRF